MLAYRDKNERMNAELIAMREKSVIDRIKCVARHVLAHRSRRMHSHCPCLRRALSTQFAFDRGSGFT